MQRQFLVAFFACKLISWRHFQYFPFYLHFWFYPLYPLESSGQSGVKQNKSATKHKKHKFPSNTSKFARKFASKKVGSWASTPPRRAMAIINNNRSSPSVVFQVRYGKVFSGNFVEKIALWDSSVGRDVLD